MKAIDGYFLIKPEDLSWRPANLMKIPNADFLERTGSENLSARLWRYPPKSAGTLHKHIRQEEFYLVLEGTGRLRVGDETLTVPRYGGVLVGPDQLRHRYSTTPTPRCSGLSSVRRRKLNFCPRRKPSPTCRSSTRLTQRNCPRNSPVYNGRQKVDPCGEIANNR